MKAVVAAFNQEKALVGAFSVITNLRMELFEALSSIHYSGYSALAAATSWKISDEEDKNISYKLYPSSRGAGRRGAGLSRAADQAHALPPVPLLMLTEGT